ncbi:putative Ig domain-containing protein [Chroococcus sp. FPU101]|uniref:putative Ig domain-containing protein n=1 Tax=Chroococcus sp. FPU101 TaxID=1974212 RepID=UPI001A8E5F1F|nr:putative Ig domain-containing protein [Chroococcus sp. FPU101]GFE67498.1 hypothetical protein CFPU101_01080 [Chroococcus sp. FPU101]
MTTLEENPTINAVQPSLTPVRWIGTNGDWYDTANWSTGRVPTANDLVTIENTTRGTTYEITFSNGNPAYGGLNLLANNGGSLKLTGLTTYRGSNANDISIEARGNGSVIDLSDVTSLNGGRTLKVLNIDASQGGQINLSNVTRISGGTTEVFADGAGSSINLSRLTEFIDDDFTRSLIKTRNAGFINLAQVTNLEEVDLSTDNSVLYLERLSTYAGDNNVDAINGGQISLIRLNSVVGQILQLKATGTRSRIAISQQLDSSEYLIQEISGGDVIVSNNSSGLNYAPIVVTPISSQQAQEDQAFSFTIPANTIIDFDPFDNSSLVYTASLGDGGALPSWLSFNAATRTFSGTPNNSQVGRLNILVRATDGDGAFTSTRFNLDVINVNDAPVVSNAIADKNTAVGQNFNFTFANNTFTDEDLGDSLTYTATLENGSPLPSWLSFNATTRTFSGNPTNADAGTFNVYVTATDEAGASVTDTFALNISDPTINNPPSVANAIADQSTTEDQLFSFQVPENTFDDIDADPLTYSATLTDGTPLPSWLTFDPATSTLSGTPTNSDIPTFSITYSIRVTATDPENASVSDDFALTLTNVNDAPSLAIPISDQGTVIDRSFSYELPDNTFTDIDPGEILNYSASLVDGSPLPSWLTFEPISETFSGTPSVADYGALEINVVATDSSGASISDVFALNIDIDAAQYGASYPDLSAAYGYDLSGLRDHYRDLGRAEGRSPDLFDEFRYVASNTDLIPIIGMDGDAAARHYIESGLNEGRSLTSFQSDQYIASYGDLISSLGYNIMAGSIHYIQSGFGEGRAADTFDEYRYLAGYDDLLDYYESDVVGATAHYILFGSQFSVGAEGRDPLAFKPDIYVASYGDLIQALQPINSGNYSSKINYGSAHYVVAGRAEGRAREIFNPASYLANNSDVAADPIYGSDPTRHYIEFGYFEDRVV